MKTLKFVIHFSVVLLLIAGCDIIIPPEIPPEIIHGDGSALQKDFIEGHYIVVLSHEPASRNARADEALEALTREVNRNAHARVNRSYRNALTGFAAKLTDEQVDALQKDPRVLSVEQDSYDYPTSNVTVQEYTIWGLDRIDQREQPLDRAYAYTETGTGVTAYIIDSGIRYTHDEFGGRASLGHDFVLEDDPDNTDPNQAPGEDCSGHGTHVAGTVGGATYGVAKDVDLVSVRVFGCTGGSPRSRTIAAVDWVTGNAVQPAVVNMSLGGGANNALDVAIENSIEAGFHYVTSAGNSNNDACYYSPARSPVVLTVGASQIDDHRAWFSNYGPCVDVYAPGVAITSASNVDNTSTNLYNGTSMASPHVAGIVAMYLENNPGATPAQVLSAIVDNSEQGVVADVPSGSNNMVYSLWTAVDFTPPPPPDITLTTAALKVQGNQTVDLTWHPNGYGNVQVFRNGTVITAGYNVGYYRDNTGVKGNSGTYVHQICEMYYEINACSEEITTIFGDGDDDAPNVPPTADFIYQTNGLSVQFTDTSTDSDGTIVSWSWTFGDGNSSVTQHPYHTYSEDGTYTVSLTVTDNDGATDTASKSVTVSAEDPEPGDITLTANGYKVRGRWHADLYWTPSGTSGMVDVYRNGSIVASSQNNGSYTDATDFRGGGSLTYMVCEAGTNTCSNEVTVNF